MGGNTSRTRKITIENDNAANVIKVSDDVVERLKGKQKQVRSQEPEDSTLSASNNVSILGVPLFLQEPSLTSLQIRQQKLEELKKNDEYWENRIKNLEDCHRKINDIMEDEYKKTLDNKKVPLKDTKEISKLLPPCHEVQLEVIACYKQNAKNPMNCSNIVQAFQDCVDEKRTDIMAGRC
ncbi:MICOS complex subunit MIC19 [Harmonia axyridis]|uniref:MICOS complex subunit MIC19 n=1 Tax=Harmonia axyridis TaxID=115357 RepID=UPI001E279163|nr:MICOS complex subunit MIC19 [Harmonia axyridis]